MRMFPNILPQNTRLPPRTGNRVVGALDNAIATLVMLAALVAAILAGLAVRFVVEFLRELGNGDKESSTQEGSKD